MAKRRPKTPGRPVAVAGERPEARTTLISTAARLFAEQGFEATSLRQVAEGADVTPAMVAYYFKDKAGLLEAVVRDGLTTMLAVIETTAADHEPGSFVANLVSRYMATISQRPWIPQILIREVISKDSALRELFVNEFAGRAAKLVPARVAEEMQGGALRADLDPRFAILSLVGMCLFPFIAHPVLGELLNYDADVEFGEAYGKHVYELFMRGAGVTEQ